MREAVAPDWREAEAARDRSGEDQRDARWVGLQHDAAYFAARAVAEGRKPPIGGAELRVSTAVGVTPR